MTRIVCSLLLGLGSLVSAAPADFDGEWALAGSHERLGAYSGWLRITVARDGAAQLHASLSHELDGRAFEWSGEGRASERELVVGATSGSGLAAALEGGSSTLVTGRWQLGTSGRLAGSWSDARGRSRETATRVSKPGGLPAGFDWDPDAIARLGAHTPELYDVATPAERARMIERLQGGSTSGDDELAILAILRRSSPLQRHEVLRHIDAGGDHRSVSDLVFDDLDGEGHRAEALALVREASFAAKREGLLELGVISDIDDTAIPTLHTPDGHVRFAGAAELYRALELGQDGRGTAGDVHYISARPIGFITNAKLRLAKAGMPEGTFDRGNALRFLAEGRDGTEAEKVADGERWLALHPAQKFICLGDTRERDPEVYRTLRERHPEQIALIVIHRAGGKERDASAYPGQVFVENYPQAAHAARQAGLLR